MRRSVAVLATTAALVAVPAATAAALSLPQAPQVPTVTYISTRPYLDPALLMVELDTSDGLRAALHLAGSRVVNISLGDYTDRFGHVTGPVLRVLDCNYTRFVDCGIGFAGAVTAIRLPAVAVPSARTVTTTTVNTVEGAASSVITTVTQTVTTVKAPAVPAVTVPTITVPAVTIPAITVPAIVPALPADAGSIGGLVSGVLGSVDATLAAVLGTTPALPVQPPAPQGLLGALLG